MPMPVTRTTDTPRRYSARRTAASFTATLALVAVLAIDHTAATVHAAQPLGSFGLNDGLPLTIAHRGDPSAAPENTLPAFEAALRSGAQVLELDVQQTADGHAVLFHDDVLDRTSDGTGPVGEHTLAELKDLDAGSWYGSAWAGTRIPTFEQFLPLLQSSRARALIELKGVWTLEGLRPVIAAIYRAGVQDRVVLASFERATLLDLWREAPSLPRAAIARRLPDDVVAFAAARGASTVVTSLRSFQIDPDAAARLRAAGLTIIVYTLNRADLWQQAVELGVDGVVTDAPRRLAQMHAEARSSG
jgi:glycerophosphoryl diester phosphodiesterase